MKFEEMFGKAKWVTPGKSCSTPYMRKEINVSQFSRAEITVCGLGFYHLFINEKKVGDDLFVTLATDYHQHKTSYGEKLSHRIICQQYDVTDYLSSGKNVIGFLLGYGYYLYPYRGEGTCYGDVKACFNLEITLENGEKETFYSDTDMIWNKSFVSECNNFLCGETQDFNDEETDWCSPQFNAAHWNYVECADIGETEYQFSKCPVDKAFTERKPSIICENEEKTIYDIEKNDAGWAVIKLPKDFYGNACVRFSEEINGEALDETNTHNQYFNIINNGLERTTHPFLTWHAFRYAEVTKPAELIGFIPLHSDIKIRAYFNSSNAVLNWIYKTFVNTLQTNMHCGLISDCPHAERAGYTGDGQVICEAVQLIFNSREFYRKWIYDIFDAQDEISGHSQYTAPLIPNGGGPGGWGCAIIEVPYTFYKVYGEIEILEEAYTRTKKYFAFLDAHSENNLVVSDQPGAWCLGDWCTAEQVQIPEPFVNTYFYIKSLNRMIEIGKKLGYNNDVESFVKKVEILKKAITDNFYNLDTGEFCNSVQGSNSFALDIGLGNKHTYKQLIDFYSDYGMFDTGIFGTEILLRTLFANGNGELAYKLLSSEKKYSFGNWMKNGATTFWEYWTGERSHNHPMFGASARYLFTEILGIQQSADSSGFKSIIISPAEISLSNAEGYVDFDFGRVAVSFERNNENAKFVIQIPTGVSAEFEYRGKQYSLSVGENIIDISLN